MTGAFGTSWEMVAIATYSQYRSTFTHEDSISIVIINYINFAHYEIRLSKSC